MENGNLQQLKKSKFISLGLVLGFFLILHIGTIGKENLQNDAKFKKDNGIEGNYTIDKNGLCNVDGNVDLSKRGLKEIPIPFGTVSGDFFCSRNQLTSLEGAPTKVGGKFACHNNSIQFTVANVLKVSKVKGKIIT